MGKVRDLRTLRGGAPAAEAAKAVWWASLGANGADYPVSETPDPWGAHAPFPCPFCRGAQPMFWIESPSQVSWGLAQCNPCGCLVPVRNVSEVRRMKSRARTCAGGRGTAL